MDPSLKGEGNRGLRTALVALAVIGLGISAYLTWVHFEGIAPVCAGGSHGCETVQASRYATLAGIPVPLLGLFGYALLFVSVLVRGEGGAYLGLLVTLVGTLFSAYLTYLELFVIHAICQWCVTSAVVMLLSFVLAFIRVWRIIT
ncbi:MAG: vitamin K epoxide reductase family protein [Rubrobacteraceae bacterium]|nr:vitamin K epoxide reductase family protein [Rubrobacteraceae bacterium]